jgi:S-DNA-T family DNA segregation ATPase FtsK/SpoIIIE
MARRRGRRRTPFKLKLKKDTIHSIASISIIAVGGFIILSFSRQGPLLERLYFWLSQTFGGMMFFLPFLVIIAGLLLTKLKWRITRPNVLVGSLLSFFTLAGLTQSGILGLNIWQQIAETITRGGAAIVLFGLTLIGFIIATETTFDEILLFLARIIKLFQKSLRKLKKPSSPLLLSRTSPIKMGGMTEQSITDSPKSQTRSSLQKKKTKTKKSSAVQPTLTDQVVTSAPLSQKIWKLPPLTLLKDSVSGKADRGDLKKNASVIEKSLDSFGIQARVVEVNLGPAVTQYALEIALGTKLSKITALQNDLALALAAPTGQIRIEAPIPGRSLVGIEIPNRSPEFVPLKKMLQSEALKKTKSKLAIALGLDVSGNPIVDDVKRMPHILIAGSTGSGKSVALNAFIATILFRASPEEVKLILVDPKRVELTQYANIPHLLTPVIIEPEKVVSALKWAIAEMERRYRLFAEVGVRNITSYNELSGFQALPFIVILVDELADIILFAPSEVEDAITRLAQMARATGIHLVISTQRPSVDVITGLIKANITCRIAFNVSSMVDSRVIIDMPGAEKLLGRGDMLYIPPDKSKPTRIQGTFVSEKEIQALIQYLKGSGIEPEYTEEVTTKYKAKTTVAASEEEENDELFEDAVRVVCNYDRASASLLQRRLSIGYARAARILDQLETAGIVSAPEGSKPRDVLITSAKEYLAQRQTAS